MDGAVVGVVTRGRRHGKSEYDRGCGTVKTGRQWFGRGVAGKVGRGFIVYAENMGESITREEAQRDRRTRGN